MSLQLLLEKGMWTDDFYSKVKLLCNKLDIKYKDISFVECFDHVPKEKALKMEQCLEEIKGDFVFPYGCINFANYVKPKVEGVFWNDNLNVNKYLTNWQDYMINKDGYMSTYGLIKANKEKLFADSDKVFIRPNKNNKVFTGKVYHKDTFDQNIKSMGYSFEVDFIDNTELVWIFPVKTIVKEYRLAIINRKIITSSLYNENGLAYEKEGCPDEIMAYAGQIMLDKWQPDDVYSLDIGVTEDAQIGVMEIGCLNCSGWYSMDVESILIGLKNWEIEYNEQNG